MSEVKNRKRNTPKAAAASESLSPVEAIDGSDDPSNANGTLRHEGVLKETPEVPRVETNNAFSYLSSCLNGSSKAFTVSIEIDAMSVALFFLALLTRMWRLEYPRSIVFDELHYGKFASLYMKNIFFFDSHPPLGKQLVALAGYLAGFDGDTEFDRIGGSYSESVPLWALRFVPAFFGSLLVPVTYHLALSLGLTQVSAALAAVLVLVENSLLTQSRFVLMEGILMCFSALGLLALLKFRRQRSFTFSWWLWLILSVSFLTCSMCVKYIGIFSMLLAVYIMARDFWRMLGNGSFSDATLWAHFIARATVMTVVPLGIYLGVFYVHLSLLTRAGPHDNIMTSAFQASLEGGLASITRGQPLSVVHGSQITLRHTHGRACWLHSHPHVYPVKYPDGRGSSHQQQVTCYSFKDVNNWWIVKRPSVKDIVVSDPPDVIKHGDIVQLIHGMTSRALNSHDVASPMSPQHQEVSCYINYNISFPSQNLWKVDIVNRDTEGDIWHTIHSHVRLIHVNTSQALKFSGKQLPDWGFHQHEVVTDRFISQDDTVWNVEEHRYTKNSDEKERERDMVSAEFVPLQPTHLTFFQKMWELQYKMLLVNQENVQDHVYSSEPMEWPLMVRGIAYWISPVTNAQIHLIGNVVTWYTATVCLFLYLLIFCFYLLRRQRLVCDIPEDTFEKFRFGGELCVVGYAMHLVPYFFADRTLFLHHYLPALLYKILVIVVVLEHLDYVFCHVIKKKWIQLGFYASVIVWLLGVIYVFWRFSVFSYGTTALSAQDVLDLKWRDSWSFIIHRP
ncbi:protein O-mannosyltransferase 1 [Rhipicephalus sanguineus]|uniref:protein O-mannosyltransferase 1 n=1 Tax=Rhipicephalus sanguineus TaxID=34632 RepID=UPI001894EA1B|nr:protein O-mannosyltransferase 1 [Rhipicephalus sanguineus]